MQAPLIPLQTVLIDLEGAVGVFCNSTGVAPQSYDLLLCLKRIADIMCLDIRVFVAQLDAIQCLPDVSGPAAAGLPAMHPEIVSMAFYDLGLTMFFKLKGVVQLMPHYTYIAAKVVGETIAVYVDRNPPRVYEEPPTMLQQWASTEDINTALWAMPKVRL